MRKKKTGVSVGTILYVVLLVILSLVLVIQISYIASELRDDRYDYSADEDDYIGFSMRRQMTAGLVKSTQKSNRRSGLSGFITRQLLCIKRILLLMTVSPQRSRKPGWTDLRRKPDPTDLRQAISTSCSASAER